MDVIEVGRTGGIRDVGMCCCFKKGAPLAISKYGSGSDWLKWSRHHEGIKEFRGKDA